MSLFPLACLLTQMPLGAPQTSMREVASFEVKALWDYHNMIRGAFVISSFENGGDSDSNFLNLIKVDPVSNRVERVSSQLALGTILFIDQSFKPHYWDRQSSPAAFAFVQDNVLCSRINSGSILTPLHQDSSVEWELNLPYPVSDFSFNSSRRELAVIHDNWYTEEPESVIKLEIYDCRKDSVRKTKTFDLTAIAGDKVIDIGYLSDSELLIGTFEKNFRGGHQQVRGKFSFKIFNLSTGKSELVSEIPDIYQPSGFCISDDHRFMLFKRVDEPVLRLYEIGSRAGDSTTVE